MVDARKAAAQKRDGTAGGGGSAAAAARPLLGAELLVSSLTCQFGVGTVECFIFHGHQHAAAGCRAAGELQVSMAKPRPCLLATRLAVCTWQLLSIIVSQQPSVPGSPPQVKLNGYLQQFLDGAYDLLMGQASAQDCMLCWPG